jgi:hypothetical protein
MIGFKPCFGFDFFSLEVPFLTHLTAFLSRKSQPVLPLSTPPSVQRRRNPSRPVAVVVLVLLLAHRRRNPSRLLLLLLQLLVLLLRRRRRLVTAAISRWAFQTHVAIGFEPCIGF